MSRDQAARRFLFVLLIASLLLAGYVAWPLATPLLLAGVLALVLAPVQERLTRWLRGRNALAAGLLVLAVLFLVVGPLLGLTAVLVKEATDGVRFIIETVRSQGVAGLVEALPVPLDAYARFALERLGDLGQLLQKHATEQGPRAASAVAGALVATGSLVFDLAMMLIALFFLLVSGKDFFAWIESVSPLRPGQTRELLTEFRKVSYAVIVASMATAAVQTAVAFVGYLIAAVPHPVFFALIGGIGAFGMAGLLIGPLAVATFLTLLRMYRRDFIS